VTPAPVPFAAPVFATAAELPRDDRRFSDYWLVDLVSHWAEWRHPRAVAPNALSGELCTLARDARAKAEHAGWVIESGESGYRVVDFHFPDGARVYLYKRPGRQASEAREELREMPGQLAMRV